MDAHHGHSWPPTAADVHRGLPWPPTATHGPCSKASPDEDGGWGSDMEEEGMKRRKRDEGSKGWIKGGRPVGMDWQGEGGTDGQIGVGGTDGQRWMD